MEPRSADQVISQAIKENRPAEIILYTIASIVVLVGVFVIVYGLIYDLPIVSLAGAIAASLFIPAMKYAKRIRKENLSIRMLEIPLGRADTALEASQAIRDVFLVLGTEEEKLIENNKGNK